MHHIAVCRHVSEFASEQRILSAQSALYVEAMHEPDQNAGAPYVAYHILACFNPSDLRLDKGCKTLLSHGLHVVMLFVQIITQVCAPAEVPFTPVPRP